ncbi:uncharacterized protein CCOS01_11721 [Colletotrichum costaricense]|uniref:Uncharacterized protein n=1 Tax=Colletotrichum costaricense TaxID=1209916 RepID=A0AAI9YPP5_9PEZI|nr:uncharacterized protein CCOS01_11721 [Colletotrichum costaricense]KAK1518901.1 hypothetical protein CCOS01_11721 [Colletotrichum costaricense]
MSFYSLLLVWVSFFLLGLLEFGVIMVFRYRMGGDGIWTASTRTAPWTSFHILEIPDQSFMDQPVEVPPIGQWPWTRKALTPTTETPKPFWISS